ncbi:MAG TPA: 1-(5-phosphoribosyl)-5-[(5-phosphoribosylamino)methylideneamino] imidazole-4-carboxamide isomerase [Nitrosopumilaceae archaeon]|nr:1-(5-phosphoribosyl)-5-[(5-phosphoribosylamino)methylideneamino] imidazole-4-carboxamide isomerase [Nitrosopumilaceae archaeon]
MKVIPAIDLMDGKVVRLVKGDPKNKTIYSDDPVETAKKWQNAGADTLHIVDLDATLGTGSNLKIIKKIGQNISIPIQVAGGLRNEDIIHDVLSFASKAVIGTLAFKKKEILPKILAKYGENKIIISTDQLNGKIVIDGWKQSTDIELISGIESFVKLGFSEFLLTSVDRDGTMQGPDLISLQMACAIKNTRIIASGGISSLKDTIDVKNCGAHGVILGKALYDRKISIEQVREII